MEASAVQCSLQSRASLVIGEKTMPWSHLDRRLGDWAGGDGEWLMMHPCVPENKGLSLLVSSKISHRKKFSFIYSCDYEAAAGVFAALRVLARPGSAAVGVRLLLLMQKGSGPKEYRVARWQPGLS
jgi:hypothetical protein